MGPGSSPGAGIHIFFNSYLGILKMFLNYACLNKVPFTIMATLVYFNWELNFFLKNIKLAFLVYAFKGLGESFFNY